jgi:hypothetical protein
MASDRKPISAKTRYEVLRRDSYTCQACGAKAPNVTLQVDHIKAVANGGGDGLDNLRAVCVTCNLGKSDTEVEVAKVVAPLEPGKHPLVGWGVLTYKFEDGKEVVSWQGVIRDVVTNAGSDLAVIDWFEWFGGGYTYSSMMRIADMAKPYGLDGYAKLFPSNQDRNDYYDWKHGKRGEED